MDKIWDEEYIKNLKKLDEKITESKVKLNYDYITEHYFEMYETALNKGTIMPYRFNPIGLAYRGEERPIKFSSKDPDAKKRLEDAYATRTKLQFKYANPDVNQEEKYEKFLDKEVFEFIEEFPQYKDIIYHDD